MSATSGTPIRGWTSLNAGERRGDYDYTIAAPARHQNAPVMVMVPCMFCPASVDREPLAAAQHLLQACQPVRHLDRFAEAQAVALATIQGLIDKTVAETVERARKGGSRDLDAVAEQARRAWLENLGKTGEMLR